jgi:hypothetical protein
MKPGRDADALAAKLTAAANTPLPLPNVVPVSSIVADPPEPAAFESSAMETMSVTSNPQPQDAEEEARQRKRRPKPKEKFDTIGITLRPGRDLYELYVLAAAERTRRERKLFSPQQIMLEILADGVKRLK